MLHRKNMKFKAVTFRSKSPSDTPDERAMTTFVDVADEFTKWLISTMGWGKFANHTYLWDNYYEDYPNGRIPGRGAIWIYDKDGKELSAYDTWSAFRKYLESHEQATLLMGTSGQELIQDESGAVIGIYADQDGKRIAIHAKKGIILGTGGFDFNENMRRQYLPTPIFRSVASLTTPAMRSACVPRSVHSWLIWIV